MIDPVPSIYLDYAATTPLDPEVLRAMMPYLGPEFGNPSSIYQQAQTAKTAIEDARQSVAGVLELDPAEIIFTSGATESDNLALAGVAWAARKAGVERPRIISTAIEHSAIIESLAWLESVGFAVTLVGCDASGMIDPEQIRQAITPDTALVSVMYANNEVGSIQPIAEIAAIARGAGIPFHVDATQAAGLLDLRSSTLHADLLSISAHKFYGPNGSSMAAARKAGGAAEPRTSPVSSGWRPHWRGLTDIATPTQHIAVPCGISFGSTSRQRSTMSG
jgi:cysteine desulfurase